jgi:hypothetical protein
MRAPGPFTNAPISYAVARLIGEHGEPLPTVRRERIPRASMIAARRSSRRLFLATLLFRQTDDCIAIAFAGTAERPKPVEHRTIKPDAHFSVRSYGLRRAGRERRLYGLVGLGGNCNRDHAP